MPIQVPAKGPAINAPRMVGMCSSVMARPQGNLMYPMTGSRPNKTVRAPRAPIIASFLLRLWFAIAVLMAPTIVTVPAKVKGDKTF